MIKTAEGTIAMISEFSVWAAASFPPAATLLVMLYVIWQDPYIEKINRRTMLLIVLLVFIILVLDCLNALFLIRVLVPERIVVDICCYAARPLAIVLLLRVLEPEKQHPLCWVLLGINTAIHMTAVFSPICFTLDSTGLFIRGPLGYTSHIVSGILLIYMTCASVRISFGSGKRESLLPVLSVFLIAASVALDSLISDVPVSMVTHAMVLCCVLYYIWLHLRFVRAHENALMAEQRIQIMISQIQPHFLYNTLSTIQALCRTAPEKASEVTERFGTYLRQNLDALRQTQCIPVEKELEHTRVYTEIEALRFPNVHVEYKIQDTGFSVPSLTIQPLVENAIRHGVRIREDGRVEVRTRAAEAFHEITITDNGIGFDLQSAERASGDHIGLKNVQERVAAQCGGSMEIVSQIGSGTTITIRIPK